jgi:glycosyltransferase involved in cell wall biosynthesis
MNPLISVIIPIYKVEDYICKCVNSVLEQEFQSIEVILVDDGSPDRCPAICDEYVRKDQRVKVIHKSNGGSSDARNVGIQIAQGDYIMFLDSDDYWEGYSCLKNLTEKMNVGRAEVILYGAQEVNLSANAIQRSRTGYNIEDIQLDKETAIKSLFKTKLFPGSAWIMALKREFIVKYQLTFKKGIKAEDIDWIINVFTHASFFDAVNNYIYVYNKNRPGSITVTSDSKSVEGIMYSVKKWMLVLEENPNHVNKLLLSYLGYQYITSFVTYAGVTYELKKKLSPELKQYKRILKYEKYGRGLICRIIINVFGIKLGSSIIRKTYMIVNEIKD